MYNNNAYDHRISSIKSFPESIRGNSFLMVCILIVNETAVIIIKLNALHLAETREFSNERGRVERREQFQKERARQMFNQDFNAYLNWITEAGLDWTV